MPEILLCFQMSAKCNIFQIFKDVNFKYVHKFIKSVQANIKITTENLQTIKRLKNIIVCRDNQVFCVSLQNGVTLKFNCYENYQDVILFLVQIYLDLQQLNKECQIEICFVNWSQIQNLNKSNMIKTEKLSFSQIKNMMQNQNLIYDRNFKNFKIVKKLGEGQYGKVYLIFNKVDQEYQALKVCKKNKESFYQCKKEIEILKNFNSQFLISYKDNLVTKNQTYLLTKFYPKKDLYFYYHLNDINESQVKFIAANLILAIEDLLVAGYLHRDIKLENIILDEKGYLVLCDFGLSTHINNQQELLQVCGTVQYMSPEIIVGQMATIQSDIWSLGILLFKLLTKKYPFFSKNLQKLFKSILFKDVQFDKLSAYSSECQNFLRQILKKSPKNRLGQSQGLQDLKNHAWLNSVNWKELKQKKCQSPLINSTEIQKCKQNLKQSFDTEISTISSINSEAEIQNKIQLIYVNSNQQKTQRGLTINKLIYSN